MKILMFGRGVIATQYAWALEKAGNIVTFYVRSGRISQYGSTVNLEILDARVNKKGAMIKEAWTINMIEEFDNNHDYDLIIVSVNHNQLDEVIEFIKPRLGSATLFIFNNIWIDPIVAVSQLPTEQMVWGFPGAGGGYVSSNTLKGGFMKSITMGFVGDKKVTPQHTAVRKLFEESGFSISEKQDMRSWLWVHFAMNAALYAQALSINSFIQVFDSVENLKQVVLLTREILPLIKKKGGKVGISKLILHLPAKLLGYVLNKVMAKGNLPRKIIEPMSSTNQLYSETTLATLRDVFNEGKQLGVRMSKLEKYEELFQE